MDLTHRLRQFVEDHSPRQQDEGWWDEAARHPDPMSMLVDWRRAYSRHSVYLGLDGHSHGIELADQDSPLLAIGPGGSSKTSALVIPNVLVAPGFVLAVSSRADIFRATARVRARYGRVLHFSASGHTVPGAVPVRFSPLQGCEDYSYAQKVGRRWASWIDRSEYALQAGMRGHPHFRDRCSSLLSSLYHLSATDVR